MDQTTQVAQTFLTQQELAEMLRLPERTLEDWRLTHAGPPYLKLARRQLPAGELGTIDLKRLPSGRYRARASTRDDSGTLHRLAVTADTEDGARAKVRRQAMALSTGGSGALSPSSTIADAVELWLVPRGSAAQPAHRWPVRPHPAADPRGGDHL
jgi:hypothetical protein